MKDKLKEDISKPKYCDVKPTYCTCSYGNCPNSSIKDKPKNNKKK